MLSNPEQGSLKVGEKREIRFVATPGATVAEGLYPLRLQVTGSNSDPTPVNIKVAVTQSGVGGLLFKVSDIYTATDDKDGNRIPGLANTRIKVQHEITLRGPTLTTDQDGEVEFTDLAAGNYRFRASAANHQDLTGRFIIKPGLTGNRTLFLDYNLISVEWSVTEITIEDQYEITLQAIFETDVPAAVVVMAPASVTLPEMAPGDVFYGELRLTNHGLVRADDLVFTLPGSDAYFRYEFLNAFPKQLESKESLLIPYVSPPCKPQPGRHRPGWLSHYQQNITGRYGYTCANGSSSGGTCGTTFTARVDRTQCSGAGSIGSAASWSGGWSGGGGGRRQWWRQLQPDRRG